MPTILCTISSDLIDLALQCLPKLLLMPVYYILPAVSSQTVYDARLLHSPYTHAIFTVVLAINEKHTLPVKHANTLNPLDWSHIGSLSSLLNCS